MTVATIEGVGAYLPKRLVTNAELEETLDTNDEWIRTRTGITQRYLAACCGECVAEFDFEVAGVFDLFEVRFV